MHNWVYNIKRRGINMILKKIGEKIRKYRMDLNISQENFANKIGMDRTYYSSIENGKHNITILNLMKILEGLNITLEDFFKNL